MIPSPTPRARRAGVAPRVLIVVFLAWVSVSLPAIITFADESAGSEPGRASDTGTELDPVASRERRARELSRSLDDTRPNDSITLGVLGQSIMLSGEYEVSAKQTLNPRLRDRDDDRVVGSQKLELEFLYEPTAAISMYAEAEIRQSKDLYAEDGERDSRSELRRGQFWVLLDRIMDSSLGVQLGRQNFRDDREWWWDEDLDAVRLHYDIAGISLELGLARELFEVSTAQDRIDIEEEDVIRLIGRSSWEWAKRQTLELFFSARYDRSSTPRADRPISRNREDESDANLLWLGVRESGRIDLGHETRLRYWVDLAMVQGHERLFDFDDTADGSIVLDDELGTSVRGYAFDVGGTLETRLPGSPTLTLALAMGSGDSDPNDAEDRAFRQTGLQDNNGKFRGVSRFRYYGELLRPELANLEITTAALGFRFLERSSIDIVFHTYRQPNAARLLRDSDIDFRPTGRKRSIGQEIDVILGIEEWKHVEIEIVGSLFRSGNAFGEREGELAGKLEFQMSYNF